MKNVQQHLIGAKKMQIKAKMKYHDRLKGYLLSK